MEGKNTTGVEKFPVCTREKYIMKTIFIMWNRNELVIELFLDLYLVGTYDSYICIYVCAYVYHEYACTWLGIFIFMFYLLFGIDNDCVIMFISLTKV